jgi:cytochrome c oxidase subunit 2
VIKRCGWLPALPVCVALQGCAGVQSMTGGAGLQGQQFNDLFSLFMVVTGIAYALVLILLAAAILRRGGKRHDRPDAPPADDRLIMRGLLGWVGFIGTGLTILIIASYFTDRQAAAAGAKGAPLNIIVTANQWWWKVEYAGPLPSDQVVTANELHLPAGLPAKVTLKSNDVIHSFWVPNLAGKQDLIPGRETDIMLLPTKAGRYRGQCAEYCGQQHAHMAFDVTVESPAEFNAWRQRQLAPAAPPRTPLALVGYNYVTGRECSICHNISGTPAGGQIAPDLTHFASRSNIAAGTFPMTRGHLYAWIADPQGAKPGTKMPYIGLDTRDLHGVVAYLETLK